MYYRALTRPALTFVAFALGVAALSPCNTQAALLPVFDYRFPGSSADLSASPDINDLSSAGNDGAVVGVDGSALTLSSNVPAGMSGMSLDFTAAGVYAVRTNSVDLMTTDAVHTAGGFTYEAWIRPTSLPTGTGVFKIIDYAGTDHISITSAGLVRMRSLGTVAEVPVSLNEWHHIVARFDTSGNQPVADPTYAGHFRINGLATLIVDGVATTPAASTKTGQGDMLNRSISIGAHPTSFGERFIGQIYNPSVSLGVVPEPGSIAVAAISVLGLLARRRR